MNDKTMWKQCSMSSDNLRKLLKEYKTAPKQFQATSYWSAYEKDILDIASNINFENFRSGNYPKLATFGFSDGIYNKRLTLWKKLLLKLFNIKERHTTPYSLQAADIHDMAYHFSNIVGENCNAKTLSGISASSYGNPTGLFQVNDQHYTIPFLSYYVRYCFAHKHMSFKGNEILVELGSGSGFNVEVLKKLYPEMTIICFDLPAQVYLCENYISGALGEENIVTTEKTLDWSDLSLIEKGKVHFLPNWMMPLLKDFKFDIFWNAASFGEMEPSIVENYLSYIRGNAKWIYLLQMKSGQKTTGKAHVKKKISLNDYTNMLDDYTLIETQDAYSSISKLGGNYFEGVWKL
jgi:putative sugar O-methyltransferase